MLCNLNAIEPSYTQVSGKDLHSRLYSKDEH